MTEKIAFKSTSLLSKTAKDILYNPEILSDFLAATPSIENFKPLMKKRQKVNREKLAEVLLTQNKNAHENSKKNIELLKSDNTFTVTTGHQIGLFTGPLYSIYKIISTLNLAKKLSEAYPDSNFVPIFWMATEDHDFAEINHLHFNSNKVEWNTDQTGPVGRFSTEDMTDFLNEITSLTSSDLSRKCIEFYKKSDNLADAHSKIVNHLFSEFGVVVLDADNAELKKEMIPVFKAELTERKTHIKVDEQSETLIEKGYKKQVTPREINLFYQQNGLRERIVFTNNAYQVLNTELNFTEKEILEELNIHPERFSPNVVMRPMYQEVILPNLAYIGGPGELAYWLQLKSGFELHSIDFPMLILRNSALLIPSNIKSKMNELPFETHEYLGDKDALIKKYIQSVSEVDFEEEIEKIEQIFELTKDKAGEIDTTLERTVAAELRRAQHSFNKIQKKVTRAEKNNHSIAVNRIETIVNCFFPNGNFQERYSNILEYYEKDLINNLISDLISLEDNLTLLTLNGKQIPSENQ